MDIYAAAYRDGKGHCATLVTTIKHLPLYSFRYIPKKGTPCIIPSIMIEMELRVKKLTTGQGGVDWHYIRATSGAITSTTASLILRRCQADIPGSCRDILPMIGISAPTTSTEEEFSLGDLNAKTVIELKDLLRIMNLPITGTKSVLIERILQGATQQQDIKQELLKIWFMKPLKNNTNFKIGLQNEDKIASYLPTFFE